MKPDSPKTETKTKSEPASQPTVEPEGSEESDIELDNTGVVAMNETLADSEQSVSSLTTIMKNCRLEDGDLIVNHQVTEERCSQLSQQKQVMEENNPKRKRSRPEFYKSTEENNVKSKRTRPEFYKGTDYHNRISDWSNREKEQLLTAMKKHGYLNMRELCRAVPTKSKDEMKIFIGLWFEMSSNTLTHGKIHLLVKNAFKPYSMDSSNTSEKCPVDQWLEKLESAQPASGYNEVECLPIAKSFLFISKFERHPPPDECGGIDFRSLYEYIYCMLCGYPARSLSPPTAKLLLDSVQELAQGMKEQGLSKESEFLDRVQRVSYNEGGKVRQYSGKKIPPKSPEIHDIMESCMRSLMELRGFNPLNVPLELLKMSK